MAAPDVSAFDASVTDATALTVPVVSEIVPPSSVHTM